LTNGGVLAAARTALAERVSGALASGFHHAFADHGEGFCTFNGLVLALDTLWAEGHIRSAAILDLDLHYGNGTASLVASRPWIRALSIYGNDYANNVPHRDVTVRRHLTALTTFSADTSSSDGASLEGFSGICLAHRRIASGSSAFPGRADPLRDDPYSPLDLDHRDLFLQDKRF
jgi:hypothetical protein